MPALFALRLLLGSFAYLIWDIYVFACRFSHESSVGQMSLAWIGGSLADCGLQLLWSIVRFGAQAQWRCVVVKDRDCIVQALGQVLLARSFLLESNERVFSERHFSRFANNAFVAPLLCLDVKWALRLFNWFAAGFGHSWLDTRTHDTAVVEARYLL